MILQLQRHSPKAQDFRRGEGGGLRKVGRQEMEEKKRTDLETGSFS